LAKGLVGRFVVFVCLLGVVSQENSGCQGCNCRLNPSPEVYGGGQLC